MRVANDVNPEEEIRKSLQRIKQPIKESERLKKKFNKLELKLEKLNAKRDRFKAAGSARKKIKKLKGAPKSNETNQQECLGCLYKTPKKGLRVCPLCEHAFDGDGWEGGDLHWRARHEHIMPYWRFWDSLCPAHRG